MMKMKITWKHMIIALGIILTTIVSFSFSQPNPEPDCLASPQQSVVRWKDQYWPCRRWWSIRCMWPIRRRHTTYKITVPDGVALRNENGMPIVIASGKIRDWRTYDAAEWNQIADDPRERRGYPDYEPIAENEYVAIVQTRYRLFHDVEANLRICTQMPENARSLRLAK
jgi:hypothetical protein